MSAKPSNSQKSIHIFRSNRRIWWIAGILSYLVPGLGQVYNGQAALGLLFYAIYSIWGSIFFLISMTAMRGSFRQYTIPLIFFFLITSLAALLAIIVHAIRNAIKRKHLFKPKRYNKFVIYLAVILICQGTDYAIRKTIGDILIKPYRIPTSSMSPTIEAGDLLLTDKLAFSRENPTRGDVVLFAHPKKTGSHYIYRLIGAPGDSVEIREKKVFINGIQLHEPYAHYIDAKTLKPESSKRDYFGPIIIPEREYFLLGDNRDNCLDSRFWGTVDRKLILGKPTIIYWSWDNTIPNWNLIKKLSSVRKSRIGKYVE
jgi:signal peptidase I